MNAWQASLWCLHLNQLAHRLGCSHGHTSHPGMASWRRKGGCSWLCCLRIIISSRGVRVHSRAGRAGRPFRVRQEATADLSLSFLQPTLCGPFHISPSCMGLQTTAPASPSQPASPAPAHGGWGLQCQASPPSRFSVGPHPCLSRRSAHQKKDTKDTCVCLQCSWLLPPRWRPYSRASRGTPRH